LNIIIDLNKYLNVKTCDIIIKRHDIIRKKAQTGENMTERVIVTSSGGKDSILGIYEIKNNVEYEITALLTTITEDYYRISMHGVRHTLLEMQAKSLNLPLEIVFISKDANNEEYEEKMRSLLEKYQKEGVDFVVFGDIFLEEVRKYRESNLAKIAMKGIFPLWEKDTTELAFEFIDLGFKAIVTCVDSKQLDGKFVGREYNREFLADLPKKVDPCGENGEFHSFVYDGPIFEYPIRFKIGEKVLRENRFYFCDLILK
jgi:uncharacterized protein (TIGR00290 family)